MMPELTAETLAGLSTQEKRALLARLLREKKAAEPARDLPVSASQRRMWLLAQLDPGSPTYTVFAPLRLRGALDESALRRSVTEIVRRHEALRTTFHQRGDTVFQRVGSVDVVMPVHDLSAAPERAGELLRELNDRPFDLAAGPLLRTDLLRLGEREHILLLSVHHIAFDGWSRGVFGTELMACYAAFQAGRAPELAPLPVRYTDYTARRSASDDQLAYWRERLAEVPPVDIPGDRLRPPQPGTAGARYASWVPDEVLAGLTELSRRNRTTLFITLLAAFQTLLARLSGTHDISVVTPVAGRTRTELEGLIGLFLNSLVLRTDLSGDPGFTEALTRVNATAIGAYAHQDVSFDAVVEELRPSRDLGRPPFTPFSFLLQNVPEGELGGAGLDVEWLDLESGTAKSDLQLIYGFEGGRLGAVWVYRTELYRREDIERFDAMMATLLAGIVAAPGTPISALPLGSGIGADEYGPVASIPDVRLPDLVSGHAARTPDAPAVDDGTSRLTYGELDDYAHALAHKLIEHGVRRGDRVGIHADRTVATPVAALAVLLTGAAYLPLDPEVPDDRRAELCADADVRLVLTDGDPGLGGSVPVLPITLEAGPRIEQRGSQDDVAYVLYTSGSTGKPKGVAVPHRAVLNYLTGIDAEFGLPGDATYAMVQPFSVDSSVIMLWGAFHAGGLLVLIDRVSALDAETLRERMARTPIDCMKIAPTHLALLHRSGDPAALMPKRWLSIGGEASQWDWARMLTGLRPGCAVYNHYGPTETTVGVTTWLVDPDREPRHPVTPIGRPLANVGVHILDRAYRAVPVLVTGDLYISGESVALGYHGRPDLTAAAFVPDPFGAPGARMYRTGDVARWRPDGTVEFLGRADAQVKIRGNRVEPDEVAVVLRGNDDVDESIVDVVGDGPDRRLIGYVTLRSGANTTPAALRAYLAGKLPKHMVPARIVVLEKMPLSAHGKVNRRALAQAAANVPEQTGAEPDFAAATPAEIRMSEIWRRLLGVSSVGRADNFFAIGGHSLLAAGLVARLTEEFGVAVPLREVFAHQTVATLTEAVQRIAGSGAGSVARRSVVRFGPITEAPVIFWTHPVSGTVSCYRELAALLAPEFAVVGLQSPDLEGADGPRTSIEELAAIYLEAILATQPDGRYRLAGWSMGGLISIEVARQLRALGREVAPVLMVDSYLAAPSAQSLAQLPLGVFAAEFVANIAASDGRSARRPTEELAAVPEPELLAAVRDWLIDAGLINDSVPESVVAQRLAVFRANGLALRAYRGGPYEGDVVLVKAEQTEADPGCWAQAGVRPRVTVLPGDHFSVVRPPTTTDLAALVRGTFSS